MSLAKKTENWVNEQIITREQQTKILAFEGSHGNNTFWNVAMGIAGSLIGLGFCLLIAANWQAIPDEIKLAGDFAVLGGFFYAAYWSVQNQRNGLKELFVILSFLGIGATIGLVGQIFQLSGGWTKAALFWAVLSLPFIWVSRVMFFNVVWVLLVLSTCDFAWLEKFCKYAFEELSMGTLLSLVGTYAIYTSLENARPQTDKHTLLPAALAKIALAGAYAIVCYVGMRWGIITESAMDMAGAYIIVFGFFAMRMYMAVRHQDRGSFKRNAIWAEIYIFIIFSSRLNNLGLSGLGFIGSGLLILFFIWVMRRTSRYIKQMEIFK